MTVKWIIQILNLSKPMLDQQIQCLNSIRSSQSVDAWVTYVRTRESVLSKHYGPDSLMMAGCVGEPRCRALLDTLLASLEPLRLLPFSLDLMFEMRELHRSFKKIESDMRAASRVSIFTALVRYNFKLEKVNFPF